MKTKVILDTKDKEKVYVSQLTDKSVVGVLCNSGDKLIIVKRGEKEYVGLNNCTLDLSTTWSADSVQGFVKKIRNAKKVFVFDTNVEALKWLAKKEVKELN